jgi:hypothetical protein
MFGINLFPPQVLSDLNFFNVNSEQELASRLRAVQRVAAAAIGAYLMVRYEPILVAKLGSNFFVRVAVAEAFVAGYGCLSVPAMALSISWGYGYELAMGTLAHIRNREIKKRVINVAFSGTFYFLSQIYKDDKYGAMDGPNFLERLFQKVEDRWTQPLWDRFYKQV